MGEVKKVLFSESLILMQGPSDIMFLKKREKFFTFLLFFFVLTAVVMVCHIDKRISATGQKHNLRPFLPKFSSFFSPEDQGICAIYWHKSKNSQVIIHRRI